MEPCWLVRFLREPGIERGEREMAAILDFGDRVQVHERASVLVDLDRLHHAHLLVVHHVAMQHEDAGVVEET
jgi:hypothetical protein